MFGDYAVTLPSNVIAEVGATNPNEASPNLSSLKFARIAIIPETEDKYFISNQKFKMLSSGDNMTSRNLYENNQTFEQTAKCIACMNNIGSFNNTDEATIERFTIIPFTGKYVKGAPINLDEQIKTNTYERDSEFSDKVRNYINALLWVLVEDYNTKGIYKKSEDDIKASEEYFQEYNIYNKFISDNLIVQDNRIDSKVSLSIKDIFPIFNKWYSEGRYKGSQPNRDEFGREMDIRFGKRVKQNSHKWIGISIKI